MTDAKPSVKREHGSGGNGGNSKRRKKRRYKQHSNTVTQKELGKGSSGFLISCTPKHEVQCFRDALFLFERFIDVDALTSTAPTEATTEVEQVTKAEPAKQSAVSENANTTTNDKEFEKAAKSNEKSVDKPPNDIAAELAAEISELKSPNEKVIFERVDMNVKGSVFVRVKDPRINLEDVVERILVAARESGEPGCRFCMKINPIRATCYASANDAAVAAVAVAQDYFPEGKATFAIEFKHRVNSSAHRADYIPAIGDAMKARFGDRFTVNLDNPDVVLIVEVVKTSCCVGAFTRYKELGKMNVREAAKKKEETDKKTNDSEVKDNGGKVDKAKAVDDDSKGEKSKAKDEETKDELGKDEKSDTKSKLEEDSKGDCSRNKEKDSTVIGKDSTEKEKDESTGEKDDGCAPNTKDAVAKEVSAISDGKKLEEDGGTEEAKK